jgi:hypothetical protein
MFTTFIDLLIHFIKKFHLKIDQRLYEINNHGVLLVNFVIQKKLFQGFEF